MWPPSTLTMSGSLRVWDIICIVTSFLNCEDRGSMALTISYPHTRRLLHLWVTWLNLSVVFDPFNTRFLETPLLFAFWHIEFSWFFSYSTGYFFSSHLAGSFSFFWSPDLQMMEGPRLGCETSSFFCGYSPSIVSHGFTTSYKLRNPKCLFSSLSLSRSEHSTTSSIFPWLYVAEVS